MTTTSNYPPDSVVTVYPYVQHVDGGDVTIANATRSTFLSLPCAALDLLHSLAQGKTIGETQAAFADTYGEMPDMADFLGVLEAEGFVTVRDTGVSVATTAHGADRVARVPAMPRRYHFEGISQQLARRLCARPVLLTGGALIAASIILVAHDPSLIPSPRVMVVTRNLTLFSLVIIACAFAANFLHELAHLVGARAVGVPARMGLGNRLWILVTETDISGIWLVPRRQRYLPLVAGPAVDAVSAALLVLAIAADQRHWLALSPPVLLLCRACLFTYLARILWQCYLFVSTDFYYVIATAFDCKNLMGDTEAYVLNKLARVIPPARVVDQSMIPARERRVIRVYALLWLAGRGLAFAYLFAVGLPILSAYAGGVVGRLTSGHVTAYVVADTITWSLLTLIVPSLGMILWVRGIYRTRRS